LLLRTLLQLLAARSTYSALGRLRRLSFVFFNFSFLKGVSSQEERKVSKFESFSFF